MEINNNTNIDFSNYLKKSSGPVSPAAFALKVGGSESRKKIKIIIIVCTLAAIVLWGMYFSEKSKQQFNPTLTGPINAGKAPK